jgi:hypothetical protein
MRDGVLDLERFAEAFERGPHTVRALADSCLHGAGEDTGRSRAEQLRQEHVRQAMHVIQEADRLLEKAGIVHRSLHFKVFAQILTHAACESDEDLITRWAGLLASSATGASVHVSYPPVLAELSAAEFRLVDRMYQWYLDRPREIGPPSSGIGPLNHGFATQTLKEVVPLAGDEFRISMANLFRLGLCLSEQEPKAGSRDIFLTPLGFDLVRRCRGPRPEASRSQESP